MFQYGKPIFLKDLKQEKNITAFFAANFECDGKDARLLITGATYYRVTVNGSFAGYGPARAAHGFTKVDEIDLSKLVTWGLNQIVIEVASYNCNQFACVMHPGFLQAEVWADGKIAAATGENFAGYLDLERVQKVMRYSYQRHFTEVYLRGGSCMVPREVETVEPSLIPLKRDVPYPDYQIISPASLTYRGHFTAKKKELYPKSRFIDDIGHGSSLIGFELDEIEYRPYYDLLDLKQEPGPKCDEEVRFPQKLKAGEYLAYSMGKNVTGFIQSVMQASGKARVVICFQEKDDRGLFDAGFNSVLNLIDYRLEPGEYENESFEVYEFMHLFVFVLEGEIELEDLSVREYVCPLKEYPKIQTENENLRLIYEAAVETFRQNTLDVFMDCPSRERAGWLFDSYYTAKTAFYLMGNTVYEDSFLTNFILNETYPGLPKGALPMCYPADILNGEFIPQWNFWFVVQVGEYLKRNEMADKNKFKNTLYEMYRYYAQFRNSDGLLEGLGGWQFVEWSKCNSWVNDVNYPTNMLFAKMTEVIGTLYEDGALLDQSKQIKKEVIRQSFNGTYFLDHAKRGADGRLRLLEEDISETCQYYALLFGVADLEEERFSFLKKAFSSIFGPFGKNNGVLPPFEPSNSIMGIYMRMELLLRYGMEQELLDEIEAYFLNMARQTGTLWEHKNQANSLNHGFASYVCVAIAQALEGLKK